MGTTPLHITTISPPPGHEAVARMREADSSDRATSILEQRVALLEQQLRVLETDMRQIEEVESFRRELEAPPSA